MTNPLLLPEVLSRLFDYSSFLHLKKYRQVCRKWNEEINFSIKSSVAPLKFSRPSKIASFLDVVVSEMFWVSDHVHIFNSKDLTVSNRVLSTFLHLYGRNLAILQFHNVAFSSYKSADDFCTKLCKFCPKLKLLDIELVKGEVARNSKKESSQITDYGAISDVPLNNLESFSLTVNLKSRGRQFDTKYLMIFLTAMPNLKYLEYNCKYAMEVEETGLPSPPDNSGVHVILNRIRQGVLSNSLRELKLSGVHWTQEDTQNLSHLNIQLTLLDISTHSNIPNFDRPLNEFLKRQQSSLDSLSLVSNGVEANLAKCTIPGLSLLTHLCINLFKFSFHLLDGLSLLSHLTLMCTPKRNGEEWDPPKVPAMKQYPTIEHLKLIWEFDNAQEKEELDNHIVHSVTKTLLHRLPQLRSLETVCDDTVLNYINVNCHKLTKLVIRARKSLSEKGFIGMARAEIAPQIDFGNLQMDSEEMLKLQDTIKQTQPYIGHLEKLEVLEISRFSYDAIQHKQTFSLDAESNLIFLFGLSCLKNLKTLNLKAFISKKSLLTLANLPHLHTLYAVPKVIGIGRECGRTDYPTTVNWIQKLMKTKPNLRVFITVKSTSLCCAKGDTPYSTKRLKLEDVYLGASSHTDEYVYLANPTRNRTKRRSQLFHLANLIFHPK